LPFSQLLENKRNCYDILQILKQFNPDEREDSSDARHEFFGECDVPLVWIVNKIEEWELETMGWTQTMPGGSMSITSVQSYEMRIARTGDKIGDPPEPYWQTVERLLADRGSDHVARLLAYALRDLDKAQGKA
jgi:hypothetical protein